MITGVASHVGLLQREVVIDAVVVDDCPVYAYGLAALLRGTGFEVRHAAQGDFAATIPRTGGVVLLGKAAVPELFLLCTGTGAAARIARDADVDTLMAAIWAVLGSHPARVVPVEPAGSASQPSVDSLLSPRERQVLNQIARGLTHGRIAEVMGISRHTVDTYVKRIRAKLNLGNKAELACAAISA